LFGKTRFGWNWRFRTYFFSRSFVSEKIALNDPVNDVANSIARGLRLFEHFLNLFAIREADWGACGISGKLAYKVSSYCSLIVIEQEPFEFANILEFAAIRECAGGIHRQPKVEGERLTREADARFGLNVLGESAIPITPAAHDVEAFKRESGRIDLAVTGAASGIRAVTVELLSDRNRASDIGL